MNIHVFCDSLGSYSNQFCIRARKLDPTALFFNVFTCEHKLDFITYFDDQIDVYFDTISKIDNIDRVFFHSYSYRHLKVLNYLKTERKETKIVWIFWSGEFYNLWRFEKKLFDTFSLKYFNKHTPVTLKKILIPYYYLVFKKKDWMKELIKSYEKIDYFASTFVEDFYAVKKHTKSKMKHVDFTYFTITEDLLKICPIEATNSGYKIMVNHSADPCLNHYEVLSFLNSLNIKSTVFLPLNYGDKNYKSVLLDSIKSFNLNIEVLNVLLEKDVYYEKLKSVKTAIFNNKIQQGVGNILILLLLGVKIFFRKESAVYLGLKRNGFIVFNIEEIIDENSLEGLTIMEQKQNKELLLLRFNENTINKEYIHIFNI